MKKLISLALVLMLAISCVPVSATTLEDKLLENGVPQDVVDSLDTQISVPTEILEKLSEGSKYLDGPIRYTEEDFTASVDIKAVVDLAPVKKAFEMYIAAGTIAAGGDAGKLETLNNTKLSGQFTVTVNIPEGAAIPDEYKTDAVGFSCANGNFADNIYSEVSRNYTDGAEGDTLVINLKVKNPTNSNDYLTVAELQENADFYFGTLEFVCPGIIITGEGEYTFSGDMVGVTSIASLANIAYEAEQAENQDIVNDPLTATVIIEKAGASYTPPTTTVPGGQDKPDDNKVTITIDVGEETITIEEDLNDDGIAVINVDDLDKPVREGRAFTGWYYDAAATQPATGEIEITKDTTLYAGWVNITAPDKLNSEEHNAYVNGYPDGTVKPEANITREEVATIFYRLLKDEERDSIYTQANNFTDVPADLWSAEAISTMANGGYITGDAGTSLFRPTDAITRAEFITIATRFLSETDVEGYDTALTDINGHWAEDAILLGVEQGWISGYEDGTFRPEQNITRAEAMTIINRVLVRYVNEDGLCDGYIQWPDNAESDWYYYTVIEATNSHDYTREEGQYLETWTDIKAD